MAAMENKSCTRGGGHKFHTILLRVLLIRGGTYAIGAWWSRSCEFLASTVPEIEHRADLGTFNIPTSRRVENTSTMLICVSGSYSMPPLPPCVTPLLRPPSLRPPIPFLCVVFRSRLPYEPSQILTPRNVHLFQISLGQSQRSQRLGEQDDHQAA